MRRYRRQLGALLAGGTLAFLLAGLSIADMFLPRPYDGVILEADAPGELVVRQVVSGVGARQAGIKPGDRIVGIDREVLRSPAQAAELLNRHHIGDKVPYLVRSGDRLHEVEVELGRRRIGDASYLFACMLGFSFFFVGLFVMWHQPRLPAARVFFIMGCLFLLFLVCRLRPASYSWVDTFVLTTGTVAILFLPPTFLHFFISFPRPVWEWRRDPAAWLVGRLAEWDRLFLSIYLVPPLVYAAVVALARVRGTNLSLISGAPAANWWLMVVYMMLGLGALAVSALHLPDRRQRRGAALVFLGSVFGVVPFLVVAVGFPAFLNTERFTFYGVVPLILVPLTFAYSIVRFQLMDIQVILRKSLLYTVTTALVTAVYALGIALFNHLFRGTSLAQSPFFPVVLALAIVVLFEPLRNRLQVPVDSFFFAERSHLQRAMVEMGEAFSAQLDLTPVVRELVERLPGLLGLHFSALYLARKGELIRAAGPVGLPERLPNLPVLVDHLRKRGSLVRLEQLGPLQLISPQVERLSAELGREGVEVIGLLASPRRFIGLALLSGKTGQMTLEQEELQLLRGLFQQASIALETSTLLEERTRQAELEQELRIAAAVQESLLPNHLSMADGWRVAAVCRPAREVGGDFYTELPGPRPEVRALVYGDVSGKSVPGALMMMAAHEVLHALALAHPDPEELFELANKRLHTLRQSARTQPRGSFVAMGYLSCAPDSEELHYLLAGQPPPLKRSGDGGVVELEMPPHRIPVGAFSEGGYRVLSTPMGSGDMVLAYSDGVIEACSPGGEFFGTERLRTVVADCSGGPEATIAAVLEALETFAVGERPYDDLTLVAISKL